MKRKPLILLLILVISIFSLSACADHTVEDVERLVNGNISAVYLGEATSDYLNLVGATESQVTSEYENGIKQEALFFSYYMGLIDSADETKYNALSQDVRTRIENMYKDLYKLTKFELRDPEEDSEDNYSIELVVEPLAIMETALAKLQKGECKPYNELIEKYNTGYASGEAPELIVPAEDPFAAEEDSAESDEATEETEEAFTAEAPVPTIISDKDLTNEFANVLVDLIESLKSEVTYKQPKTFLLHVAKEEDDSLVINSDDWIDVDINLIYYP